MRHRQDRIAVAIILLIAAVAAAGLAYHYRKLPLEAVLPYPLEEATAVTIRYDGGVLVGEDREPCLELLKGCQFRKGDIPKVAKLWGKVELEYGGTTVELTFGEEYLRITRFGDAGMGRWRYHIASGGQELIDYLEANVIRP